MVERIDQLDLEYAELQAPVGWKIFSNQTKIYIWSSGKKSGIEVPTQECVCLCASCGHIGWDGLTRKDEGTESRTKTGEGQCCVSSLPSPFGWKVLWKRSLRELRLQMHPFPRHPGPGSNSPFQDKVKPLKAFAFPG